MENLTTTEAAEQLGVSVTTIKAWLNQLPLERDVDSRGRRRIDQETLSVLETVKSLRAEDCGYQTIRRRMFQTTDDQLSPDSKISSPDSQPSDAQLTLNTETVVAQVIAAIREDNALAEKYARAAHQIGGLEAEVKHLTAENAALKEQIFLLSSPAAKARPWWRLW